QKIRLTPAAAEIPGSLRARSARLLHPAVAAEAVERIRLVPDLADARLLDVRELEPRQDARRMARQRDAVRSDRKKDRPEPVHARLRPLLEVVRNDEVDSHALP